MRTANRLEKLVLLALVILAVRTLPAGMPVILPLKERAAVQDRWLKLRLETVVPSLMRREGIDMWLIVSREYNEDPVFRTMSPARWFAARRRTILLFFDDGQSVERLAISRYPIGEFFESCWDPEKQPDQWIRLRELVAQRKPERIGVNFSRNFALADGMTSAELAALEEALGDLRSRVVSAERLAVGWLETRIPEEMDIYPSLCRIAHEIISEGLSNRVIQPGHTTTTDLEWWFRQRLSELGLDTWFHPSVSVQRPRADDDQRGSFADRPRAETIQRGDLVHVDFGVSYLGLNTDTQQHAYVLQPGEVEAPGGLRDALDSANRLQDILMSRFVAGKTGNEILAESLSQARKEGVKGAIYSHPLGYHGHAAGPTIGMWDQQGGVPGQGDYPLHPNTVFSIELNVTSKIPEWDHKEIRVMLEEDAFFDGTDVRFLDGRQTEFLLIR